MLNLIGKLIFSLIIVYILPSEIFWNCSQSEEPSIIKIQKPDEKKWNRSPASLIGGISVYHHILDQSISLKSVILSKNIYPEVYQLNEKLTVDKLFGVKKTILKTLGASDYKINSFRMINRGAYRELDLAFQFYYKSRMTYTRERYYIHPEQTLRLDLTWTSQSGEESVRMAQAEFGLLRAQISR